jgi:hypothetical protein
MNIADLFYSVKAEGIDKVGQQIGNLADTLGNVGGLLIDKVSKPILDFFVSGVDLASDLTESMNVVNVTFGKAASEVSNWAGELLDSFGLTEKEALQYVGSMGAMLKSSGLTAKASKDMSKSLVELTGDMSSFYNLSHDEAWEKIRAGISGETEPLKALGINMSVANLEAYALSKGINKAWKEMSQAEQITLRYNYLMQVSADSQGDFARTQDGFANKLRTVQGRIEEFSKAIGEVLLPYVEKAINLFDDLFVKITTSIPGLDKLVVIGGLLAASLGPLLLVVSGLVAGLAGVVGVVTALVALISTVGLPVFVGIATAVISLSGWLVVLGGAFITVIGTLGFLLIKTGLLQIAFDSIKAAAGTVAAVFNNDIDTALKLLTENFGMTRQEATDFYFKMKDVKESLFEVWEMIKNVSAYLNSIFSEDAKKQVDILVEKFGYSKKEATELTNKIQDLKNKIIELGLKLKEVAGDGLAKFLKLLKDLLNWVYDNRAAIIKFVDILVTLGNAALTVAGLITKAFNIIKTIISAVVGTVKTIINTLITKWLELVGYVSNTQAFGALKILFKGVLGTGIELISTLISKWKDFKDVIAKVAGALSKVVLPGIGNLMGYAEGGKNIPAGWAIVGEHGPELVNFPRGGSDVYNNRQTRDMLNNARSYQNSNTVINYNNHIENVRLENIDDIVNMKDFFDRLLTDPT